MGASRPVVLAAALVSLAVFVACGSRLPPPAAGESTTAVPDLTGRTVMVLPVQAVGRVGGDPDAELAFALQSRMDRVDWVMPEALRGAVEASPSLDVRLEGLPVGIFLRTEVERVGDPLFGILRRLGALTGGEAALIPVQVGYLADPAGAGEGTVRVTAAILDVRSGYVLWFGVEEGEPGAPDDVAVVASALDALARRLAGR